MSNSKYEAFAAVASLGSFSRAAQKLGYTQSGVSHLVRTLEDELQLQLVDRSKAAIRLTSDGEKLLPHIQQLLASEQAVHSMVTELKGLSDGKLKIGSFSSFTIHLLPDLIRGFSEQHSGLDIHILGGGYAKIESSLEEGELDCAVITEPSRSCFSVTHLMTDRMMAVIPNKRPEFLKKDSIELSELRDVPYVVPAEGTNFIAGELLKRAGVTPAVNMVMDDDFAAIAMVSMNFGYTILPELLLKKKNIGNATAIPIKDAERKIGIAVYKDRYLSPAARAFVNYVIEDFKKNDIK